MRTRNKGKSEYSADSHLRPEDGTTFTASSRRKHLNYILLAAKDAAAKAPADVSTWLACDEEKLSKFLASINEEAVASEAANQAFGIDASRDDVSSISVNKTGFTDGQGQLQIENALASILGYSNDDLPDSPHSENPVNKQVMAAQSDLQPTMKIKDDGGASDLLEHLHQPSRVSDDLEGELASFMGEVEILLKEKQNDESGTEQQAATVQSDGPNQNSAKAGNGERSSQEYQHSAADTTESNATAQSDESGQAEQRVLGQLEGVQHWSEVMDMASGEVYFWNSETNEVVWEPPNGSLPRSKEAKRVIFEGGRLQSGDEIGPKSINDATAVASPILEGASLSKKMKISNRSEDLMVRLRDAQRHKGKGLGLVDPWQRLAIELDARVRDCKVLEECLGQPVQSQVPLLQRYYEQQLLQLESELQELSEGTANADRNEGDEQHRLDTRKSTDAVSAPALSSFLDPQNQQRAGGREQNEVTDVGDDMELDPDVPLGSPVTAFSGGGQTKELPLGRHRAEGFTEREIPPLPPEPRQLHSLSLLDIDEAPPLPEGPAISDDKAEPPFPSEDPSAASILESASERQKEYSGQPVLASLEHDKGSTAGVEDGVVDGSRKRKLAGEAAATMKSGKRKKSALKVPKKASTMINKWAAAQKDLASDEEDEILDAETLEKNRMKAVEEWRRKAQATPEENPNFEPLRGDWRQKVKAARKAARYAKEDSSTPKSEETSAAALSKGQDLSKENQGLPPGWQAIWDQATSKVYYGNLITKESSWERPPA